VTVDLQHRENGKILEPLTEHCSREEWQAGELRPTHRSADREEDRRFGESGFDRISRADRQPTDRQAVRMARSGARRRFSSTVTRVRS